MNLLGRLLAFLAGGPIRPTVLPGAPSGDTHATGATAAPFTNPSSGLHHVNQLALESGAFRRTTDLERIEVSRYGRPARSHVAFSTSASFGDQRVGEIENNGTRTKIAARPMGSQLPAAVPARVAREPWAGDFRTAPAGARGQLGGMESFGPLAVRTQRREVPPTDAASAGTTSSMGGTW